MEQEKKEYQAIILGGGHAGVEAAWAIAQYRLKVALITLPGVPLASAPCNPSIGGIGKGQVVKEIDALNGLMGVAADEAAIHYRTLNESRGYAVQSTRVQIDKEVYPQIIEKSLQGLSTLDIVYGEVYKIIKSDDYFTVFCKDNEENSEWFYRTRKLIVTAGTFLKGLCHCGEKVVAAGRHGQKASQGGEELFKDLDIKLGNKRFKTGTPPRIRKNSIAFHKVEPQPSDSAVLPFHFKNISQQRSLPQVQCYLTYTNHDTIDIIAKNKNRSPMYNGQIKAMGARYCPSIEDKVVRYPEKERHHIFIEPEGLELETFYPSGISSSLPEEVQDSFIQTIVGLEEAEISQYGYAVEYDVVDTSFLKPTLEHESAKGLYFAGQVNGTSGYEEAAGQGLVAGHNAALGLLKRDPFILARKDSYIGLMIEDLVSVARDEPYRLFTARAENRLWMREDNTLIRLERYFALLEDRDNFKEQKEFCENYHFIKSFCRLWKPYGKNKTMEQIIAERQGDPIATLREYFQKVNLIIDERVLRTAAIQMSYQGYIKNAEEQYRKVFGQDSKKINWEELAASEQLSFECRQRIAKLRPQNFGQLRKMEGIRAATLATVATKL